MTAKRDIERGRAMIYRRICMRRAGAIQPFRIVTRRALSWSPIRGRHRGSGVALLPRTIGLGDQLAPNRMRPNRVAREVALKRPSVLIFLALSPTCTGPTG